MNSTKKPTHFTALPDMRGFLPLVQMLHRPTTPSVIIDMESVTRVDAVGLNIFVSGALKLITENNVSALDCVFPSDLKSRMTIESLKIIDILKKNPNLLQEVLFGEFGSSSNRERHDQNSIINITNNGGANRLRNLEEFRSKLKSVLSTFENHKLNIPQVLIIFSEIVKNTLDHSTADATLAIEISNDRDTSLRTFKFSYCEQGDGLSKSLRKLRSNTRLAQKGGLSDLIHWALQPGNSTKSGNGVNYGLGMTMIVESASGIGMSLAMIDAESWLNLSNLPDNFSHAALRRRLSASVRHPCFCYLGECNYAS